MKVSTMMAAVMTAAAKAMEVVTTVNRDNRGINISSTIDYKNTSESNRNDSSIHRRTAN